MPADLWCYKIDSLSCFPRGAIVSFSSEKVITAHVMHATVVFVDKSKWLWFNSPARVLSVNASVLPLWNTSLHVKKKKKIITKQHTSPILLFMLFVDVLRKGFLKKNLKQTHFPWFRREILYLFCTCIIN